LKVESTARTIATPDAPLKLGDLHDPRVLLAIAGFGIIAVLLSWKVRGGILLGMIITAVAGYFLGFGQSPQRTMALPWGPEYDLSQVAGQLDIIGVLQASFLPVLFTLVLISFLDTLGTLVAVGSAANLLDKHGNIPNVERPMLVDACSCIFSAL